MTTKIGVSLPDATYARVVEVARRDRLSVSGLINEALLVELDRRAVADHVVMLAGAEDPACLVERARARGVALAAWKRGG